ncbi:hypothetical protein Tco_0721420 [Tanacetum coccineum]
MVDKDYRSTQTRILMNMVMIKNTLKVVGSPSVIDDLCNMILRKNNPRDVVSPSINDPWNGRDPKPGRRHNRCPRFSPMKTPLRPPSLFDRPPEDDDENKEEEEDPEQGAT